MEEDRRAWQDARRRTPQLTASLHPDDPLARLAAAHGVATRYEEAGGRRVEVTADTARAVLAALGVSTADDRDIAAALADAEETAWRRPLPPCVVVRQEHPHTLRVPMHLPAGAAAELRVELADGPGIHVPVDPLDGPRRRVDGRELVAKAAQLPILPVGWHRLVLRAGDHVQEAQLAVAPPRARLPERLTPTWGWMLQLYALRSQRSWGMGDLADLRELAAWAAGAGADFVLVNPLHAAAPRLPQEASPYYPSSRRFTSPLYLRVEDVPELERLDPDERQRLAARGEAARDASAGGLIDRDEVFRAKTEALSRLHEAGRSPARQAAFERFRAAGGQALQDFGVWCALAERHDGPWQDWPPELRHPRNPAVAAAARELAVRVDFHVWLQWLCDEQLAAAQDAATGAGMALGVVHDLAVGVDPGGADGWGLQDDLADGVTVGAPPDPFNQQGQDWRLPPLRPDRLTATAYAAFRDVVAPLVRRGGGIRIDHALGLMRQFWIPEGAAPTAGTFVRYPFDDLLGVLTLEAEQAGAVVVAEDLGTVPEGLREALHDRGILGSAVLWFTKGHDGEFLRPADYPRLALASVTTHDLPTAPGWWTGEAERLQAELGLLGEGTRAEDEEARAAAERRRLLTLLRSEGLVASDEPNLDELVTALHAFLARTPSLLVAASLHDAVGQREQPNLPGTTDEYPNWRLPLPVPLEDVPDHPGVARVVAALLRA